MLKLCVSQIPNQISIVQAAGLGVHVRHPLLHLVRSLDGYLLSTWSATGPEQELTGLTYEGSDGLG